MACYKAMADLVECCQGHGKGSVHDALSNVQQHGGDLLLAEAFSIAIRKVFGRHCFICIVFDFLTTVGLVWEEGWSG